MEKKNTGKVREFCRSGKVGTMTETRWTQLQNNDTYYWSEASLADYYCRYVPGCCTQRSLYRNLRGAGNERQRSKGLPRKRYDQQWSVSLVNASTKGNTVKSTPHTHKKKPLRTTRYPPKFCEQCDSYLYCPTTCNQRPQFRTEPGTLMGLSLESRLMFCRCDARGQQCEQSDRTSSYRKGGSLKYSLWKRNEMYRG